MVRAKLLNRAKIIYWSHARLATLTFYAACTVHVTIFSRPFLWVHVHCVQYMHIVYSTCTLCTVHVHCVQYMYVQY